MEHFSLVRAIGISHLLQAPLTALLASKRGLNLRAALTLDGRFGKEVMFNMAFASVSLPSALGLIVAYYSTDVSHPGAPRALALLVSAFWCWRLYRQIAVLGPHWPDSSARGVLLNGLLTLIFALQGPFLALLLLA